MPYDFKNIINNNIYPTEETENIIRSLSLRKHLYSPRLEEKWQSAKPEYTITETGENLLKIEGMEVMSDFQKPYMKILADIATACGGRILNIGFGLGLADSFIEQKRETHNISEHHIVELNEGVFENAEKWREKQKHKDQIVLHKGNWKDILPQLRRNNLLFDGVIYDGYPLKFNEIYRDSVPFLEKLIKLQLVKKKTGIITFYADTDNDLGQNFRQYLNSLGIQKVDIRKGKIPLPNRRHNYWFSPCFIAPILTDVQ